MYISQISARTSIVHNVSWPGTAPARPVPYRSATLQFAGNRIQVMSYNTNRFYGPQGEIAKAAGVREKPQDEVRALARAILQEKPDILALQEVESKAVLQRFNKEHLDNQYPNVVIFPTNDEWGTHVAFMYKNTVKLVESKSHRNLQYKGRPVFTRDFLEATFETPTGYRFTVFNTHFLSMRRGGERGTANIRLKEATAAAGILQGHFICNPKARLMVMGDLNTLHTKHGYPILRTLAGKTDKDPTNDMTEVLEKDGRIPATKANGRNPGSKLDYCFVSPQMLKDVVKATVLGTFGKYPWVKASDHLPIMVTLEEPDEVQQLQDRAQDQKNPSAQNVSPTGSASSLVARLNAGRKSRFQRFG